MDLNNITRNQLDYLLTDTLPNELPELFSFHNFYEYLTKHQAEIDKAKNMIIAEKNHCSSKEELFKSPVWANTPLKYTIMKGLEHERVISLLHPVSGLEILLFVSAFQKELLALLEENSVYSLRYHHRNNDLCYKNKNKSITKYFAAESAKSKRDLIEGTGMFFYIKPCNSIVEFTSSESWMVLNSKYKYFARADYKSCFDSIYTHTYTWLIVKNVIEAKSFNNKNIYPVIDRILMNINSRSSNGIVVGPEFSRMIAELLLQQIDEKVHNRLLNMNLKHNLDYNIYRYVDDIFIFANTEEDVDSIISIYSEVARKFLLELNEQKLVKERVPFVLEAWHTDANLFTSRTSALLFKTPFELQEESKQREGTAEKPCIFKAQAFYRVKSALMSQFNTLICSYSNKSRTIVAYVLGMLLNKVSRNKEKVTVFRENVSSSTIFAFIDFVLYIYSFFPDFNNTQKLLGILSYIKDEYDFTEEFKIQKLINKYAFVFSKANLNDIVNLVLFCRQINVEIPYNYELTLIESLKQSDNPLLWAVFCVYATYSNKLMADIIDYIESRIKEKIEAIRKWEDAYLYREFWWIIVFNKCPYLKIATQKLIDNAINCINYKTGISIKAADICNNLFLDYLKNNKEQFFEWNLNNKNILRDITFKTHERSIFKNYGSNLNYMNWSSI